jgi:hypothetical protein
LKTFITKRELMEITLSDNLRHYRIFYADHCKSYNESVPPKS